MRPAPLAPPIPINLDVQVNDRALGLSWEISDSAIVSRFRIYEADSEEAEFILIDSTATYTATVEDLTIGEPLRFRVTAVGLTGTEGRPSAEVTAVAGLLSIVLEGDEEYTRERDVSVRLNAPAPAAYAELSEDPSFAATPVLPYATNMSFELSEDDGVKTVYARITFVDGSVSAGPLSDDIILDTEALIDSVYFTPTGQVFVPDDTIAIFLDADGEAEGTASVTIPGAPSLDLADDGIAPDALADDGLYSAYFVVPAALTVVDGEASGSFRDMAGNTAPVVRSEEQLNIGTSISPVEVILAGGLIDSAIVHLTWTENDDSDFATYRICRSDTQGLIIDDADSLRVAILNQRTTLSYDDYLPSAGTYYYRVFVFDTQGLSAGSNEAAVTQ